MNDWPRESHQGPFKMDWIGDRLLWMDKNDVRLRCSIRFIIFAVVRCCGGVCEHAPGLYLSEIKYKLAAERKARHKEPKDPKRKPTRRWGTCHNDT